MVDRTKSRVTVIFFFFFFFSPSLPGIEIHSPHWIIFVKTTNREYVEKKRKKIYNFFFFFFPERAISTSFKIYLFLFHSGNSGFTASFSLKQCCTLQSGYCIAVISTSSLSSSLLTPSSVRQVHLISGCSGFAFIVTFKK